MPERLFNQYGAMNKAGQELNQKLHRALSNVLDVTLELYDPHDIHYIAAGVVSAVCSERILRCAMAMRREEKKKFSTSLGVSSDHEGK